MSDSSGGYDVLIAKLTRPYVVVEVGLALIVFITIYGFFFLCVRGKTPRCDGRERHTRHCTECGRFIPRGQEQERYAKSNQFQHKMAAHCDEPMRYKGDTIFCLPYGREPWRRLGSCCGCDCVYKGKEEA